MCNINSPETGSREKNELQMKKQSSKQQFNCSNYF